MDIELMQSFRSARRMGHTGWVSNPARLTREDLRYQRAVRDGAPLPLSPPPTPAELADAFLRTMADDYVGRRPSITPLPADDWRWDDNDGLVMV